MGLTQIFAHPFTTTRPTGVPGQKTKGPTGKPGLPDSETTVSGEEGSVLNLSPGDSLSFQLCTRFFLNHKQAQLGVTFLAH